MTPVALRVRHPARPSRHIDTDLAHDAPPAPILLLDMDDTAEVLADQTADGTNAEAL